MAQLKPFEMRAIMFSTRSFLVIALLFFSFTTPLFALIEIGQTVPNLCWKNADDETQCIGDYPVRSVC